MEKEVGRRRRVVFNFYDLDHITKGFLRQSFDADHTLKSRQHKPEELLQQFLVYLITKQLPA